MRLRTQRTYLFLLILTFLFLDVSGSIPFTQVPGLLTRSSRQIPSFLKQIFANKRISNIWNKLKPLFKKGLTIGDKANELPEVREYLEIFGYLNATSNSNFTDDEFTGDLQSALIDFQKNFNLHVTGQPDENTYQIISQPRCGVPDIINGTTTMNPNKTNTTSSFKPWWRVGEKEKELTYAFHPLNNVTDGVKSLFQDTFTKWSKVTALNFTETTSFNASDITIVFVTIDGRGGTVGGADTNYSMHVATIYLDSEEQWVLPSENIAEESDVDLESVVMHQVGHVLGLGHSSMEEAVMYPIVLPEKKTELAYNDDLQRIKQIYGVNSNNNSLSSSNGRAGNGVDIVLSLVSGFAFVVLSFF